MSHHTDTKNSSDSGGLSKTSIISLSFFIPTVFTVALISILVLCIYICNRYMGKISHFTKFRMLQWTKLNNAAFYNYSDVTENPAHNTSTIDVPIELHNVAEELSELESVLVTADPLPQTSNQCSLDQNLDSEVCSKEVAQSMVYVNKGAETTSLSDQCLDSISTETQCQEKTYQKCPNTGVTCTSDCSCYVPTSHSHPQNSQTSRESTEMIPSIDFEHYVTDRGFPRSISEEEDSYSTENSPVVTPKFQSSQWKFEEDITEHETATPPNTVQNCSEEKYTFWSDCNYELSGQLSASQFSTDSDTMMFAESTGCYGYLPDKHHAYSPSQISTTGPRVDSQIGILQTIKSKKSRTKERVHATKRCKKKTKKENFLQLDVRSGDSGIGQSLSPVKSLSPKQHISLTQGPPYCSGMLSQHDTHILKSQKEITDARQNRVHRSASNPNRIHCMTLATKSKQRAQNVTRYPVTETHTFPRKKEMRTPASCSQGYQLLQHKQVPTVPKCIRPTATLQNCTSAGLDYTDESIGLTLAIPKGAIADGDSLTIDVGVALHGPFHYPKGTRPTSPVLWICVRKNEFYQFKIPVEVTIQHFLNIDSNDDVAVMGLCFVKANHEAKANGKYEFLRQHENQWFEPNTHYATLFTKHFCYQCIVGSISELTLRNSNFCLFGTLPKTFVYDSPMYMFFFVTFFLHACLETVRRQIATIPELAYCEYSEAKTEFQFAHSTSSPEIAIQLPDNLSGGWQIGIQFKKKVCMNAC